jgi:hypothetical protein
MNSFKGHEHTSGISRMAFRNFHRLTQIRFSTVNTGQLLAADMQTPLSDAGRQVTRRREGGKTSNRKRVGDPIRSIHGGGLGEEREANAILHNSIKATRAAVFSDRGLRVYLKVGGWLSGGISRQQTFGTAQRAYLIVPPE